MPPRSLLAAVLVTSTTALAQATPGVHALTVKPVDLDVKEAGETIVHYVRVVAQTSALTAKLNASIAATAGVLGLLARRGSSSGSPIESNTSCEIEIATDVFVSWSCTTVGSGGPNTGGGFRTRDADAYFIDHDQLRRATLDTILVANPTRAKQFDALVGRDQGDNGGPCHATSARDVMTVTFDGLAFQASDSFQSCTLTWDQLGPLLVKDNPHTRVSTFVVDEVPPHTSRGWDKAPARFVVASTRDAVTDTATGLDWAPKDNGADVTFATATAYAAAYRGGGHADWRLPTEEELEALVEPETAHRDPTDCTKGKNDLLVTSLLHLSCGLAWSSSRVDRDRAIAVGFISGTSRIARTAASQNYRALLVRDPTGSRPSAR